MFFDILSIFLSNLVLVCLRQLQALLSEYLDAACSLLFELLLLGHEVSCTFCVASNPACLSDSLCFSTLKVHKIKFFVSNFHVSCRPADVPLLTTSCLLAGSWESCSLILTWYALSSMSPFLQNLLLIIICHRQANKSRISYPDIRNERAVWSEQRLGTSVSSSLCRCPSSVIRPSRWCWPCRTCTAPS